MPDDIFELRSIGNEKSISRFTSDDIYKAAKWAALYQKQLGVKSPFFRAWFGDWRAQDTSPVIVANIPRYASSEVERGVFENRDTRTNKEEGAGWKIRVSHNGIANTGSHSGTMRLSEKGLANIGALIENAVLLNTEVHDHHSNNVKNDLIAFDHKLYALGKNVDGSIALYRITVEEMYQDRKNTNNRRFHNLKYIEKVAESISGLTLDSQIKAQKPIEMVQPLTITYPICSRLSRNTILNSKTDSETVLRRGNRDSTSNVDHFSRTLSESEQLAAADATTEAMLERNGSADSRKLLQQLRKSAAMETKLRERKIRNLQTEHSRNLKDRERIATLAGQMNQGRRTTETRLRQLMSEKTTPRNRNESEIAGYRDALNVVHESFAFIPLTPNYILQLHKIMFSHTDSSVGGSFKNVQNYISATDMSGKAFILFTPLAP